MRRQGVTYLLRQHDLADETGVGMDIHVPFSVRCTCCIGSCHDFSGVKRKTDHNKFRSQLFDRIQTPFNSLIALMYM